MLRGRGFPLAPLNSSNGSVAFSSSHPFFTGSKQLVDSEGRVEKFKKRFGRKEVVAKDESSQQEQNQGQEQPAANKVLEKKASKPVAKKHA